MKERYSLGKPRRLFLDQYGQRWYANTVRDLRRQIPGKVSIMYLDKRDGSVIRCGYVVGKLWLAEYAPVEKVVRDAPQPEALVA
jgi:hypothetical protein